ncbi:hypothetical protein P5W99_38160 [Paraburkholderia sp. A3BS-1L]|uniref:hypothetical protein n=1 Tax=Paraburkholderia sp. A3BS-1L TaxID=3028375 RepID=UPI003DA80CE9
MRVRTILIAIALIVLCLFAILNWQTFSDPTALNVAVAKVNAPLGVILLAAIGALTMVYTMSLAKLEFAAQIKARRMENEMKQLHEIAEKSAESRVQALQDYLIRETQKVDVKLDLLLDSAREQSSAARTGH